MSGDDSRRAALVFNPVKVDEKAIKAAIADASADAGWEEPLFLATSVDDPGAGVAREAVERGATMVFAAGGDGTVRSVAEGLRDAGVPLALVPSGTGNLLARNLALPLNSIESSVRDAFTGRTREIDLGIARIMREDGSIDEHAFLVMAGMGLDAQMIANTNSDLKKALGWLAYVDAGVRSLPKAKPFRIRYKLGDGAARPAHVSTILVANCGTLTAGIELLPDAEIDDGQLDVAVFQPKGLFGWLLVWRTVSWENGVLRRSSIGRRIIKARKGRRSVTYLRDAEVVVRPDDPQPVELDGDEFGLAEAVRFTADAGALQVRVPA